MRLRTLGVLLLTASSCGSRPAATTSRGSDAAPTTSPACQSAREARTKAAALDHDGHEILALAKVDEANAACPVERAASLALEISLLANTGNCSRVSAIGAGADAGASLEQAKATCAARQAPSKGTEASMRAKMREAYGAERAKDFAKAKSIYLDAWTEQHPNPRALENAARMAGLAGDAAESRRIRDRALLEAEAAEHAIALLSDRVRVTRGSARLAGNALTLGREGKVVARDLSTGEVRVLLDASGGATTLSPRGTLALVTPKNDTTPLSVYDVLTGAFLFKVNHVARWAVSPDDTMLVIREPDADVVQARVIDTATGQRKSQLSGKWHDNSGALWGFSPDASHVLAYEDGDQVYRQWDLDKGAYTALRLFSAGGLAATSANGQFLVYVEGGGETSPLHVRDMVANKEVTQWTSRFISVEALAVSDDGKTVATGSYGSLRLWDASEKKQLYKERTLARYDTSTDSRDASAFAFSDDGKTMVLAGNGLVTAWDVATGNEKPLVSDQPDQRVLGIVPAPGDGGVAIILDDEVRIVPASGEPRTVCKGMQPQYFPMIGPTSAAFSASGKAFACAMADGWVHVFDTSTWDERAVVKKGPKASGSRPVDLVFSGDDKSLTVVTDTSLVTYDAQTAAQTSKVAFKHPKVGLMSRHARFTDGTIAVRTWNGAAAIFGADGAYQRDVKLVAGAPADAVDDFSADGKTYAVALQKTLTLVDLSSGEGRSVTLPQPAKSIALSADGKSVLVVGKDGVVSTVVGEAVRPVPHLSTSARAWFAGASIAATAGKESVELVPASGGVPTTLEVDANGIVVRDGTGGFDVRGKPELECIVGRTYLTRETCDERAKEGLVATWLRAAR